jgi:hypothetical protein
VALVQLVALLKQSLKSKGFFGLAKLKKKGTLFRALFFYKEFLCGF